MTYELYVSHNAGASYHFEKSADTIEELRPRMEELDEQLLRWYVDKDGEPTKDGICLIHKSILALTIGWRRCAASGYRGL